jgi:hypothetical protein
MQAMQFDGISLVQFDLFDGRSSSNSQGAGRGRITYKRGYLSGYFEPYTTIVRATHLCEEQRVVLLCHADGGGGELRLLSAESGVL